MAEKLDFKSVIEKDIANNNVVVYSKSYCPFCDAAKEIFTKHKTPGVYIKELDLDFRNGNEIQNTLEEITKQRSVPNIFINKKHIGGCDALQKLEKSGELKKLLAKL